MHAYLLIIIKGTGNDNIIFRRCLVPSREEGPGEDPGRTPGGRTWTWGASGDSKTA